MNAEFISFVLAMVGCLIGLCIVMYLDIYPNVRLPMLYWVVGALSMAQAWAYLMLAK